MQGLSGREGANKRYTAYPHPLPAIETTITNLIIYSAMAAHYELRSFPFSKETKEGAPLLYPYLVPQGTIRTPQLIEVISHQTTFTPGDISGLLKALSHQMAAYMKSGYTIELEGIGYFSPVIKGEPVEKPTQINATAIRFHRVNFRACSALRKALRGGSLERARHTRPRSPEGVSEERKKELIRRHLQQQGDITRSEYTRLTGLLKNKALEDLHRLVQEGFLATRGANSTLRFVPGSAYTDAPGSDK